VSSENAEVNLLKVKLEAQKKDKTIYFLAGLLIGLIVSFLVTNRINSNAALTAQANSQQSSMGGPGELPAASGQAPNDAIHGGGMQQQVKDALQKADNNPNDFDAQIAAAEMEMQIRNAEKVYKYLNAAYKVKPDAMDPRYLVYYAGLTLDQDKNQEAIPLFEKVIKSDPKDPIGYSGLGTAYTKLGQYDKAIEQFNKALAVQPNDQDSLHELTHAYLNKGDARNAEATINKLKQVNPANDNLASLQQELDSLKLTGKIPSH